MGVRRPFFWEWGVRFYGSEASVFMGVRRPFLWE